MKKAYLTTMLFGVSISAYTQRSYEASFGLSPVFPLVGLTKYFGPGFGFKMDAQTPLKDKLKVGAELTFHKFRDGYESNSFLSVSGFANLYLDINYKVKEAKVLPYLGVGLGLFNSQFNNYYGKSPSAIGLAFSPRAGVRFELDKFFITGEGRLQLGTGYANSYMPFIFSVGYKF